MTDNLGKPRPLAPPPGPLKMPLVTGERPPFVEHRGAVPQVLPVTRTTLRARLALLRLPSVAAPSKPASAPAETTAPDRGKP